MLHCQIFPCKYGCINDYALLYKGAGEMSWSMRGFVFSCFDLLRLFDCVGSPTPSYLITEVMNRLYKGFAVSVIANFNCLVQSRKTMCNNIIKQKCSTSSLKFACLVKTGFMNDFGCLTTSV